MKRLILLVAALLATGAVAFSAVEQEEKPNPKQLLGTWRMVSARYNGRDVTFPAGMTTVKHVTPEQFMWAYYDANGQVVAALGGSHEITDTTYAETPQYGLRANDLKGKSHRFQWKIEGNRWHHEGSTADGLVVEEVWERVAKNEKK